MKLCSAKRVEKREKFNEPTTLQFPSCRPEIASKQVASSKLAENFSLCAPARVFITDENSFRGLPLHPGVTILISRNEYAGNYTSVQLHLAILPIYTASLRQNGCGARSINSSCRLCSILFANYLIE